MKGTIRKAQLVDVTHMVELSEQKRAQYERHKPNFWRKANDSAQKQLPYFEQQIGSNEVISLIHEQDETIDGFVIAMLVSAPEVYDPGGLSCVIDDFVVSDLSLWQNVGIALLNEVIREAKSRGAVQSIVVCGHHDTHKRTMLASIGSSIASEWWVKTI